ncbi:MAG: SRPBCC domain-containing protein [Steroidobacteraceae bacterium]
MRLLYSGKPGQPYHAMMSSFVLLVPVVVGAVAAYVAEQTRRRSFWYHFWVGASANALFVLGCFLILIEGLICVVLAIPLFALLGGLAAMAMGAVCRWTKWPRQTIYSLVSLPLLLGGFEQHLPVPQEVRSVVRIRVVATTPDRIWRQLTVADHIQAGEIGGAWMYRIGVPLPLSAVTELVDNEHVRHIVMGKGIHFDQVAADWQPNHRILWLYRFSRDSFPARALDDHVRIGGAYFDLLDTEYALRQVAGGTELRVTMRYRLGTPFNWYAGAIARFFVGNFEETALRFYGRRALAG